MTQTQLDIATVLRRLREQAEREADPLATAEQEAEWERQRAAVEAMIAALIAALLERRITLREWELAMREMIARMHVLAYAVSVGAVELLTDADRQAIQARVSTQHEFFAAWVTALAAGGLASASTALLLARANLYLEASKASLYAGAARMIGMPPLPAYPGDGSTRCLVNCRCRWHIRQVDDASWDCYWLLGAAEHCEHCPRRAIAWAPLKIINGVLQPYARGGLFRLN